ncbi:MAG: efflux RND transporter periplasmic adaptor subunit [Gammaproteobacteria bacterium]|nr:efflux RND transporter periplasmic adaptor subunit [Gammaproteobacteria bacterium]
MLKKVLIIAAIVAVVVGVPVLRAVLGGADAAEVQTEVLERRSIQSSVLASGHLAHDEEVQLTTEEIGRVTAIYVEEGDRVTAGQLLLQIDDETHRAAVEQAAAQVRLQEIAIERQRLRLENLRAQWERQKTLYERKLIDQDSFDLLTNELELNEVDLQSNRESLSQARAQLEQAEDRLRKTRAYSPMDGVVTSLDIKVGETAISSTTNIPGSALMTIANPDSIHTLVNVDEADIANVDLGQKASVYAVAYPNQPVRGVIESIAMSAKVAEGAQGLSFEVKIRLDPNESVTLRPGMSCRAEIFTTTKDGVLAVPIQAIQVEEDRTRNRTSYSVFVNRDGTASKVEVEVGVSDDAYQEIASGLAEGDEVIIGPDRVLRTLSDGDSVTTAAPDAPDAPAPETPAS